MGEILLIIFAFGLVISGAVGVIAPFLPGMPISWLGMLVFAYATDFTVITWKLLFIFLGFTLLTMIFDVAAPIIGAKRPSQVLENVGGVGWSITEEDRARIDALLRT